MTKKLIEKAKKEWDEVLKKKEEEWESDSRQFSVLGSEKKDSDYAIGNESGSPFKILE